jgi:hypothetical protein
MEILGKLFGGQARIKVIRLFLFNPDQVFTVELISEKAKVGSKEVKKELHLFETIGLVRVKTSSKKVEKEIKGKKTEVTKKEDGWILNGAFPYLLPLQGLLIRTALLHDEEIVKKLDKVGKLRLVVIAGVFIQNFESRVDLLVAGDGLKKGKVDKVVKEIEAEIGKELRYAVFETPDFKYRLGMCDKLIRDIFDFPHKKILNKTGFLA